jgi:hypothetical protein
MATYKSYVFHFDVVTLVTAKTIRENDSMDAMFFYTIYTYTKTNSVALSPQANYTD